MENVDMNANLMLDRGIAARGGAWVTRDAPDTLRYTAPSANEA
jgi:hypothetical protein